MEVFLYFLSCVWAVLCLVLFFKIWGMCNDVSKIKSQLDRNDDFSSKIEFLLRIGEKEKAKEILIARILSDEFIFNTTSTPVEKMEALSNKYQEEFSRLGITLTQEEDEK
jgi:putative lipase involved disintegration of autophagic bodies